MIENQWIDVLTLFQSLNGLTVLYNTLTMAKNREICHLRDFDVILVVSVRVI